MAEYPKASRQLDLLHDGRGRDWFWLNNTLLDEYAAKLGPSVLAVYCVLARRADNVTRACFPSHEMIARMVGISRRTAITAINTLEKFGMIRVQRRSGKGDHAEPNLYTLTDPCNWCTGATIARVQKTTRKGCNGCTGTRLM